MSISDEVLLYIRNLEDRVGQLESGSEFPYKPVFPISTPTSNIADGGGASGNVFMGASTNCSCQPSADELDKDFTRRVSQVNFINLFSILVPLFGY